MEGLEAEHSGGLREILGDGDHKPSDELYGALDCSSGGDEEGRHFKSVLARQAFGFWTFTDDRFLEKDMGKKKGQEGTRRNPGELKIVSLGKMDSRRTFTFCKQSGA